MAEKRHELVIRVGKTVDPDNKNGYRPEELVDPVLAIELSHCLARGGMEFDIAVGDWYASGRVVEVQPDETVKPDVHPGIECLGSKIPVGSEDEQTCLKCIRNFQEGQWFKDLSLNAPCCLCEDVLEIQKRKTLVCPVWKKYQTNLPPNFYVTFGSKLKYKVVAVKTLDYGELQIPADCIHVIPKTNYAGNLEQYLICYLPDAKFRNVKELHLAKQTSISVSIEEGERLSKIEADFIYNPERYNR